MRFFQLGWLMSAGGYFFVVTVSKGCHKLPQHGIIIRQRRYGRSLKNAPEKGEADSTVNADKQQHNVIANVSRHRGKSKQTVWETNLRGLQAKKRSYKTK